MNYRKRLKGLLAYNMSEDLKQKILDALDSPNTSESELKTLNQELQSRKVLLKDRENIDWFPCIDESLCNLCKICYEMCPRDVFIVNENRVVVKRPYSCVFLCRGCANKCPQSAIQFPKKEEYMKLVMYR